MDKEYTSTTDREVYVNTVDTPVADDAGTGWAVALIVLILAIGFGFVAFSNNQAASELRTTQAIEDVRHENSVSNNIPTVVPPVVAPVATPAPSPAPSTTNVEVKVPEVKPPAPAAPAEPVEITPPAEPTPSDSE